MNLFVFQFVEGDRKAGSLRTSSVRADSTWICLTTKIFSGEYPPSPPKKATRCGARASELSRIASGAALANRFARRDDLIKSQTRNSS